MAFLFLGPKINADDDCSHEIRKWLFLGRKAMTNLDSMLKSRNITLPTKICIVKAVVTHGCENWTVKKAEHQIIDSFKLWCWRRLLKVQWTARRSNQSILRENHPGNLLERLMLKLKFQYFGHLIWTANSLEKVPDSGEDWGQKEKRGSEDEMAGWHHPLNGQDFEQTPGDSEGQGTLTCCSPWGHKESDTTCNGTKTNVSLKEWIKQSR